MKTSHPRSKRATSWRELCACLAAAASVGLAISGGETPSGVAYADSTCSGASPGASDYCEPSVCGPCGEGEGDCDPGQCAAGLECREEGDVDRCRPEGAGSSNLHVRIDGAWKGVCCDGGTPRLSDRGCWWTESDRTLTDSSEGRELDCSEGGPADCECDGSGERMHGYGGEGIDASLLRSNGGPVYPDGGLETCIVVSSSGKLVTDWTDSGCPHFRLQ